VAVPAFAALDEALGEQTNLARTVATRKFGALVAVALAVFVLALPPLAFSQGCSLCYTQAANSGARLIRALRSGIVILIIPPVSMCIGAMVMAYRKRNQFHQADRAADAGSDW
jgi:O-antigen/teichoic acid export membrane protein